MSNKMQVQISQLLGLLALKMGDGKAELLVWRWTHRTGTGRFKRSPRESDFEALYFGSENKMTAVVLTMSSDSSDSSGLWGFLFLFLNGCSDVCQDARVVCEAKWSPTFSAHPM